MPKPVGTSELRERFLTFFERQGHTRKASDSLVPAGDPSLLFTSAGMAQFKRYFLGLATDLARAASCQKCLRTGDLERVGKSASHHSFFEMLGNFSFGDYFKAEAIQWGWEFLTGTMDYEGRKASPLAALCLGLPADRLWVSVYEEDEEAFGLWRTLGVPESRIRRFGQADNFWPANAPAEGPNGPCGPCSEIYYDADGAVEGPKSVEVWNLVFTQFDRKPDGSLAPLPRRNIDTGMGLERLARVMQGAPTDYETDVFAPIMAAIRTLPRRGAAAKAEQAAFAERAIADHIRAVAFLIEDGVRPSNESRGYVLRMLIRRAYRLGLRGLNVDPSNVPGGGRDRAFLSALLPSVQAAMCPPYELHLERIADVVSGEEAAFVETLDSGMERLEQIIERLSASKGKTIAGEDAFRLYDTYGFPLELTVDVAAERGLGVDRDGFAKAMAAQQERSRAGSQFAGDIFATETLHVRDVLKQVPSKDEQFVGYEALQADTTVEGLWDGAAWVERVAEGQRVGVVLKRSPFYGESGGQIGDTGTIETPQGLARVEQTVWVDDVLLHQAVVERGTLSLRAPVKAAVDASRRLQVARSHTATHLLHWALRSVLGPDAVQAGSAVEPERLRFDFSAREALNDEQRHDVEQRVNARVRLADEVAVAQLGLDEARRRGAIAMFGEKYGDRVRVVSIGDYSKELCGGTHLLHTGYVGLFKIVSESSIAAGTRRVEALVGGEALRQQQAESRLLHEAARRLGRASHEIVTGLEELLEQIKGLERDRRSLQIELAQVTAQRLKAQGKRLNGATYVAARVERADRELLKVLADAVRSSLGQEGIVLLVTADGDQVAWVMGVTADLSKRVHAGQLLKSVAAVTGGSGGGRPEFAQAGGKDPSKIDAALQRAEQLVAEALERAGQRA